MMKLIAKAMTFVLLCFGGATQGQGHASHWVFGNGNGFHLEFNESGPTVLPIIDNFIGFEGVSSISGKEGNLLYYSNVVRIWNRDFLPLFNSDTFPSFDVPPSSSKANGSLFLPWPGDSAERYVAFLAMNDADDRLYLSKIDKLLDGGLGGLVDSVKYKLIWSESVAEHLSAVKHANGRDWWIVARGGATTYSSQFFLALLTPQGITNTIIREGTYFSNFGGILTFSPNGDLIALTHSVGNCATSQPTIALFHFDRCDGQIEFIDTITTRSCYELPYGVTFSHDGNRLYYSLVEQTKLYQITLSGEHLEDTLIFDLRGPTSIGIAGGNLILGRDDKIYVNYCRALPSTEFDTLSQYLGVITNPNAFGLECHFDTFGLYLGGPYNTGYSLPNFANYDLGPLVGSPCDTLSPQDTTQTGLNQPSLESLSWSINPSISSGSFTVTSGSATWLVVHDLYGREVLRQWQESTTTFDLTAQPAGIYLVYLRAVDGTHTLPRKIVRQ
jgi:hypothetical protein